MKWIDAEHIVTVEILDEEHEERISKTMSIEDMLDAYTAEGCPSIYFQPAAEPQRKQGTWIESNLIPSRKGKQGGRLFICSECNKGWIKQDGSMEGINFCPFCGADMRGGQE